MKLLDVRIDLQYDPVSELWCGQVGVWDGDLYVASKRYQSAVAYTLVDDMRSFWRYWSALYHDSPLDTPPPPTPSDKGLKHLRLNL